MVEYFLYIPYHYSTLITEPKWNVEQSDESIAQSFLLFWNFFPMQLLVLNSYKILWSANQLSEFNQELVINMFKLWFDRISITS